MKEKLLITMIPHTHWDRAWYCTFQQFRTRLVRLIDRLIRLLEGQPEYTTYMLDGQMLILEDYLEIRPRKNERIKQLIKQGRIQVGPWYVLMDEFLVSPESLIRNLMLGFRLAEELGGGMREGYVPDGFGHIAQLPQILKGFGIESAIFWRGMGNEGERLGSEFFWEAPDGSTVLTIWMPQGYHNVSNLGYALYWGDTSQMEFSMEYALERIERALDNAEPFAQTGARLLMNGVDHQEAQKELPEIISAANRQLKGRGIIRQGTISDHITEVRSQSKGRLERFRGEFRWGRYSEILQGVYATRLYIKQNNHRIETLLERYAEPLTAASWLMERDADKNHLPPLLWTAWRWLIKNHPHDDIYGCSIDQVHEEMGFRFSQAEQIANTVIRDSLRSISRQVDFSSQNGTPLLVYNPLNWSRKEMVSGFIDFDFDDSRVEQFYLVDGQGNPVPFQNLMTEEHFSLEVIKPNRKKRVHVLFQGDVPSCGYRAYYAVQGKPSLSNKTNLRILERGAENEYLRFRIGEDGSLSVDDLVTGARYKDLHIFADVEDAGDEYSYSPCLKSETITSRDSKACLERIEKGPLKVSYRIRIPLNIPEGLRDDRKARSEKRGPLIITSILTLYEGQPGLYVITELDNQARDHKLSVSFPTGINAQKVYTDGHFMVVERDIDLPREEGWIEDPVPMMHQRAFVDISSGERGLAIINKGLPAVEVTRDEAAAEVLISLTLLRCVGWLSRDDLITRRTSAGPIIETPGGQCLGFYKYECMILPHKGDWHEVYRCAYSFNSPLTLTRADTHEGLELKEMNITGDDPSRVKAVPWKRSGAFPDSLSWIELKAESLVISAMKRSDCHEGIIVRGYNLDQTEAVGRLSFFQPLAKAYRVNLNEERIEPLAIQNDGSVAFKVKGGGIFTVELVP